MKNDEKHQGDKLIVFSTNGNVAQKNVQSPQA